MCLLKNKDNMKLFLLYLFFIGIAFADDSAWISTRSDEVNVRTGPSEEYPIKYTYQVKDMPLLAFGQYDNWYKVRDKDNEEGWINKNLAISKRNLIVINGTQTIYKSEKLTAKILFKAEENVVLEYAKCSAAWCKVKVNGKTGWIQKEGIWGY
ncbi:MAG: hypothetical protein Ta2D_00290 [Rickettsiales bacterium]|nr:MAG: hypothetical protein Ta2D_00290 [Rickettsiales bacterium]